VLVNNNRLYLLDFDLFCTGDRGLDIGNFLGHLTEQSQRILGNADALRDCEEALQETFLNLAGGQFRNSICAYKTLTMARHIYISTRLPERQAYTEHFLQLCEQRLGKAEQTFAGKRTGA
jgi:thiamine kinase-like enzyme